MDAFEIRRQLINDYSTYFRSFITICGRQIDRRVQAELDSGLLWPDPLIRSPDPELRPARYSIEPRIHTLNGGGAHGFQRTLGFE